MIKPWKFSLDTLSPEGIASCQNETKYLMNRRQTIMKRITLATCGLAATCILITTVLTAQEHPSIMPLGNFKITSPFGERVHPISKKRQHHKGIDLKATIGTPVMATADGTVIKLEEQPQGYGKFVVIAHADNYQTKYAQLSEFKVALGDKVKMGHIIGLVGSSGASTAPHLHYEVIRDDHAIDPLTTLEDS